MQSNQALEFQIQENRIGSLKIRNSEIATPCFIHYSSVGSIPHLTPDLVPMKNWIMSVAIENFMNLNLPMDKTLSDYLVQDAVLLANLRDLYNWGFKESQCTDFYQSGMILNGYFHHH
jgi:hypothetical protein